MPASIYSGADYTYTHTRITRKESQRVFLGVVRPRIVFRVTIRYCCEFCRRGAHHRVPNNSILRHNFKTYLAPLLPATNDKRTSSTHSKPYGFSSQTSSCYNDRDFSDRFQRGYLYSCTARVAVIRNAYARAHVTTAEQITMLMIILYRCRHTSYWRSNLWTSYVPTAGCNYFVGQNNFIQCATHRCDE